MKNIAFTALTLSLFLLGSSSFGQCFVPLINQNASIAETEHEISWVPIILQKATVYNTAS